MGVFDDKHYDQLDWVSQAVQPIETPLAALLDKLPVETRIDFDLVTCNDNSGDLDKDTILNSMVRKYGGHLSYREKDIINNCFEFEMRSPELILNLEDQTLTGELYLVKTRLSLEEDVLKNVLGEAGREKIGSMNAYNMNQVRANEMLDLLEKCEQAMASRSGKTSTLR